MKAFTYIRVSTTSQDLSPEVQREQLRAYCAMKGYEIVPTVDEIGVSGSIEFAKRPVGREMLARAGEVQAFVFAKLDRAFRDVVDCILTVRELAARGKVIHFLDLGVDTSTPAGSLCLQMMAAFAEFERRRISERIKESLATAKRQGKSIGPAPFGFKNRAHIVDGRKVDGGLHDVLEVEAPTIALIQRFRSEGWSYGEIAALLRNQNVPTKRGGQWHAQTVKNIVRRIA